EYDTIGGMVTAEIGHLPEPGEETMLDGYLFNVTHADDRRVHRFRVRKRDAA
ncbi:MAG: transporter associated domain-containing protein, partial [Rhodanobacteraceae bacterium]